ncbi:hypothetical protein DPMN_046591 [Dreissena polymorpha]|uniref:Uncharacterized protein n=1 Tax=Dreissena polymorpha TaxID=45954 RepID=A0A9D4I2C6_DREPO|nr:hypothetical protein DPMN_046591 [Dreissena polymorpha]
MHNYLCKTVIKGTQEAGRRRGCQRKSWMDNLKWWISFPKDELLSAAHNRPDL